ncbi:MAG: hypothetical protein JW771_01220, partial [Candidatus Thermoplasmatota archaeon]|nr:hypothetical protein [Candidatus Thermoplasmatota archaeon]
MPNQFYAGHDIQWMQRFLDAVPEGRRFQKPIAYCLACCIHHHFVYTKHDVVRLNHEKLQQFGLIRQ